MPRQTFVAVFRAPFRRRVGFSVRLRPSARERFLLSTHLALLWPRGRLLSFLLPNLGRNRMNVHFDMGGIGWWICRRNTAEERTSVYERIFISILLGRTYVLFSSNRA